MFHASTWGSVAASIRGLVAPTMSGGRRAGAGSSTASSTVSYAPAKLTRLPPSRRLGTSAPAKVTVRSARAAARSPAT